MSTQLRSNNRRMHQTREPNSPKWSVKKQNCTEKVRRHFEKVDIVLNNRGNWYDMIYLVRLQVGTVIHPLQTVVGASILDFEAITTENLKVSLIRLKDLLCLHETVRFTGAGHRTHQAAKALVCLFSLSVFSRSRSQSSSSSSPSAQCLKINSYGGVL